MKKLFFTFILILGASFAALAQKDGEPRPTPPPRKDPPVIVVPERPKDRPKDDDKPKEDKPKKPRNSSKTENYEISSVLNLVKTILN